MGRIEYKIESSRKFIGELYPVLLDSSGKNIIDGVHRLKENPHWRVEKLENIKTQKQFLVARIVANLCRREVPILERYTMFKNLAEYLMDAERVKPKNIAKEISRLTGVSYRTVCRYLPEKYKDQDKIRLRRLRDNKRLSNMSKTIINIDSIPSYKSMSQETRIIFSPNSSSPRFVTIIEVRLFPNSSTSFHLHHESNEYAYIKSGEGKCVIKHEEFPVKSNMMILCPMKIPHQYINVRKVPLEIVYIYTPPLNLKSCLDFYKACEVCKSSGPSYS